MNDEFIRRLCGLVEVYSKALNNPEYKKETLKLMEAEITGAAKVLGIHGTWEMREIWSRFGL